MNRPTGKCNVSAASNTTARKQSLLRGDSKENVRLGSSRATSSRPPLRTTSSLADLHRQLSNAKATVTLHKHAGVASSSKSAQLPPCACSVPTQAVNKATKVKLAAATATVSLEKDCVSNEPNVSDCISKLESDVNKCKTATDKMTKQLDSALKKVKVLEKQLIEQKQHEKQLVIEKKAVEEAKAREMAAQNALKLETQKAAEFEKQATRAKLMLASLKKKPWECPICFEPNTDKTCPTATPCGHVFCKVCISQVADAAAGLSKCPICQENFFKCQLTQLFLDSFN